MRLLSRQARCFSFLVILTKSYTILQRDLPNRTILCAKPKKPTLDALRQRKRTLAPKRCEGSCLKRFIYLWLRTHSVGVLAALAVLAACVCNGAAPAAPAVLAACVRPAGSHPRRSHKQRKTGSAKPPVRNQWCPRADSNGRHPL